MDSYFCIISLPDQPVVDLCVLDAAGDAAALRRAAEAGLAWPGYARIEVYQGERRVAVIEGPPAAEPLRRAA